MFESKLNYITAGMALAFLLLAGRFAYMQVINHDHYADLAQDMRTSIDLLEPQRADIVLQDGTIVAHTESVWDVYLDYEKFADPRTMQARAYLAPSRYDAAAVQAFLNERLRPVQETQLDGPASRRRLFLYWQLRRDPVAQHDREVCIQRLCMVTGLTRGELELKLLQLETEVNAVAPANPLTAESREISIAWLRAMPALNDPEYWERIRRFPKSLHFAPVLAARLEWYQRETEYLQGLLEAADDNSARLRDLAYQAMLTCRANADGLNLEVNSGELTLSQAQDILLEEHAAWLRIAEVCEEVVRANAEALPARLALLESMIERTGARLDNLHKNVIDRYIGDWQSRWHAYSFEESPLLLVRDAPRDMVELLKVNADHLPGVICTRRASRKYSHSRELAHVIGSVGLPDPARLEQVLSRPCFGEGLDRFLDDWFDGDRERFVQRFDGLVAQQLVGIDGLERMYDERLSGLYGARACMRDASGRIREIEYEQAPTHREPLTLTIDIELQRDIIDSVKRWEPQLADIARRRKDRWNDIPWTMRGAAVVLDVKTGAVLALVSFPDYDPGKLTGRSAEDRAYQRQLATEQALESRRGYPWWNKHERMFNRATQGHYAPGSTFKVVTAAALFDSGTVTPTRTFDDNSAIITRNGKRLGSTSHYSGLTVNLELALEESCNGYFYFFSQELDAGPQASWEVLREYAEQFGMTRAMGGDIHGAARGSLPDSHEVWEQNLAMLAIGQGRMLATPLEIARVYACVANRGTLVVPHLCDEAQCWPQRVELEPQAWDLLHEGMRRVVHGGRGTANEYPVLKRIKCAGKTGTAENGLTIPDHAWFAGFAPYDDPQVAFVILAANSDLFGAEISPLIGECIERYLNRR